MIEITGETSLAIRCRYALGCVLLNAENWSEGGPLLEQARRDAYQIGFDTAYDCATIFICPIYFTDELELAQQWELGLADAQEMQRELQEELKQEILERTVRKAMLERLSTVQLPSPQDILDKLLAGKSVDIEGNSLNYTEREGVWITNDYGIDAGLFAATIRDIESFIHHVRCGGTFGLRDE